MGDGVRYEPDFVEIPYGLAGILVVLVDKEEVIENRCHWKARVRISFQVKEKEGRNIRWW